jgi:hypothetical protein
MTDEVKDLLIFLLLLLFKIYNEIMINDFNKIGELQYKFINKEFCEIILFLFFIQFFY